MSREKEGRRAGSQGEREEGREDENPACWWFLLFFKSHKLRSKVIFLQQLK